MEAQIMGGNADIVSSSVNPTTDNMISPEGQTYTQDTNELTPFDEQRNWQGGIDGPNNAIHIEGENNTS